MMVVQSAAVEWIEVQDPERISRLVRAQAAHGDLKVYATGHWYVASYERGKLAATASGVAASEADARLRAIAVYEAMTSELKEF